ncbi:MAG: YceI family protein [Gemmatimonadales bacterium]
MMRPLLVTFLVSGTLPPPGAAPAQRPVPNGVLRHGSLSFDGRATLGDFVGRTDSVTGAMTGGDDLSAVRGWVEAPVRTLLTGNGKRDKDLNKSMQSDSFPTMRFELDGVTPDSTRAGTSGDTVAVALRGRLTLHGVARDVSLPAVVVLGPEEIGVRSDFPLNLKDYRIGGLSKMLGLLKMHPDIVVHVDVVFGVVPPAASGSP